MQQYNVPQFTEVEDKIIGPFTLRQFFILLGGGAFVVMLWAIFGFGVFFWLLAIPIALLAIFISLGSINGRPALMHVLPLITFIIRPKKMVFRINEPEVGITTRIQSKKEASKLPQSEVQSRLKRLAYVLDQRREEEEELGSRYYESGGKK